MFWLILSYSLASQRASSVRVGLWRRLQNLGTVTLKNGLYVLPDREECLEAFQWIAQEVQQAKGEATVMRVERFEGLSDSRLIELFQKVAREKYEKIGRVVTALEKYVHARGKTGNRGFISREIKKLHRMYDEVARLDFFDSPYAIQVASRLRKVKQSVSEERPLSGNLPSATIEAYRNRRWVTRPRPHVDRLACVWLIRNFINPTAIIRYSNQPESDEVRFDMRGAEFGHYQNLCTFETILIRFHLSDPALQAIAEIVHEIDLRDGSYDRPETAGIDAILKGWLFRKLSDQELEIHGLGLFQALYATFSRRSERTTQ